MTYLETHNKYMTPLDWDITYLDVVVATYKDVQTLRLVIIYQERVRTMVLVQVLQDAWTLQRVIIIQEPLVTMVRVFYRLVVPTHQHITMLLVLVQTMAVVVILDVRMSRL